MTKDDALKLALEFIENSECGTADLEARIKEALAQPEQEPVEWPRTMERGALVQWLHFEMVQHTLDEGTIDKLIEDAQAIPATPPQRTWVGLINEEIETIWRKVEAGDFHDCVLPFAEKLEAKLKEKNCAG